MEKSKNDGNGKQSPKILKSYGVITKGNGEAILSEEYHTAISTGWASWTGVSMRNDNKQILVLNDMGGAVMAVSYDVTATLRANMKHHEPIVLVYDARGNGGVQSARQLQETT